MKLKKVIKKRSLLEGEKKRSLIMCWEIGQREKE